MPSGQPSAANGYQFDPAPTRAILNRATFNLFGADLHARLLALEDIGDGIATLQAELQNFGVDRLNEAINPLIVETQAALDQLNIDMEAALVSLNEDLAAAQVAIDSLLAGGVPAGNVNESGTRVFVTPEEKTEITTLRTNLNAVSYFSLRPVVSVTAAHTAAAGEIIFADSMGGAFDITMPQDAPNGTNFTVIPKGGLASLVPNPSGAATTISGETDILLNMTDLALDVILDDGVWSLRLNGYLTI